MRHLGKHLGLICALPMAALAALGPPAVVGGSASAGASRGASGAAPIPGSAPLPVCDGRTDDTAALNALFAAAPNLPAPNTGVVNLYDRAETCAVTGTLHIPGGVRVAGLGPGNTVIQARSGMTGPAVELDGPNAGLMDLTVNGGATAVFYGAPAVEVEPAATGSTIHDVEATAAGDQGIKIQASNTRVFSNSSHDNWKGGIYVVGDLAHGAATTGVLVRGNTVTHNVRGLSLTGQPGDGIDIDRMTANTLVEGNVVVGNDIILAGGIHQSDLAAGHRSTGNTVENNTLSGQPNNCLDVAGPEDAFTLSGNSCGAVIGYGILVHGSSHGGWIESNTIASSTQPMLSIGAHYAPPSGVTVADNDFGAVPAGVAAIAIGDGASEIDITGNRIESGLINAAGAGPGLIVAPGQ